MPTSAWANSREGGFTLVEMLVVLTILGIAAVLLVGRMDQAPRFARERDVAVLETQVAAARHEAVRTGTTVRLDPAEAIGGAAVEGAVFGPGLALYADGSTSGGMITIGDVPVLTVDWLTGEARRVR